MPAALVDALRRQPDIEIPEMELGWEQAAYMTVSGQNSNNTVRVSDEFMKAVEMDGDWPLIARTNGAIVRRVKARAIWRMTAVAAWRSADPGLQFDTTINDWHPCVGDGRIRSEERTSEIQSLMRNSYDVFCLKTHKN